MISGEASSPILDRQIRTDPRMVLFVLFKEEAGLLTLSTIFLKYDYVLALAKNTGMWHPSRLGGWNNAKEKPISGSSLTGATHQA